MAKRHYDKSPVKLREKPISNGNKSLYLDFYQKGIRSFEFLHLYIIPEHTPMDKERNKTTRLQAEVIRARRIMEIQENATKVRTKRTQYRGLLSEWVRETAEDKEKDISANSARNYRGVAHRISLFGDCKLRECDTEYLTRLIKAMSKVYAPNTVRMTIDIIHTCMTKAEKEGFVFKNPVDMKAIKLPRRVNRYSNYLTFEQVQSLMQFKQKHPRRQRALQAFLFGCFTGLRFSDIISLRYSDFFTDDEGVKYIKKLQIKTGEEVVIPLSINAINCIPKTRIKPRENDKVFIMGDRCTRSMIKAIREYLGTSKRITFHTSRHTFATMLLTYGVDIYTVSKLLGHTNIMTTRIYAEVTSKKREEAIAKIPTIAQK